MENKEYDEKLEKMARGCIADIIENPGKKLDVICNQYVGINLVEFLKKILLVLSLTVLKFNEFKILAKEVIKEEKEKEKKI